ncbi:MAG TPA: hypothetical protein VNG33_23235 [Polyangiaceae bacterium]|nr:hypothetical protein [Polyangiaceae bacterium]
MTLNPSRLFAAATLTFLAACSSTSDPGQPTGGAGVSSSAGTTASAGSSGSVSTGGASAGSTGTTGTAGTGTAGVTSGGTAGAGTAGSTGTAGMTGTSGSTGTAGMTGAGGADPAAPRPINVTGTGTFSQSYNGQPLYLNKDKKPIQGKLFLLLPGIGNGPGAGGFESFVKAYGFHVFAPKTDTNLTGGKVPQMYKDILKTMPNDREANRQVGEAHAELWDGKDRVDWYTPPTSIVDQTLGAIKFGMDNDPEGDWGFFLNADGTLRTTDIYVVGYSWGAQAWSMISAYVKFGKVIAASGPVDEGFPNATWMTDPSVTPNDRKYALVSDGQAAEIFPNVMKAGWVGTVTMVTPTSPGPYTADQHLFEMVGGDGGTTPGGHTVFCNDNPANGWLPVCKHVLGVQ